MENFKITLIKIQTAFYSDNICPAIFQNVPTSLRHSKYPGPKQNIFYSLLFPREITDNPDPDLNTSSIWTHPGSLSLIMRGDIFNPSTGFFRNGFKQFSARTKQLFEKSEIIHSLIQQCEQFLRSGNYNHERFCHFFRTELQNNISYFKPESTHLFQLIEEKPSTALAFFLIFSLLGTDAVSLIEKYLKQNAGLQENGNALLKISGKTAKPETTAKEKVKISVSSFASCFILPSSVNHFYGRRTYIETIHQLLHSENENPHLFLYGMSGIGKTELAKKYAATYKSYYKMILFLDYQGSLKELLCDDIILNNCKREFIDGQPENNDTYFSRKLKTLWSLANERILLIIDNFNTREDPDLKKFLKGNYSILFTTQNDFSENGYRVLPVMPFENFTEYSLDSLYPFHCGNFSLHPEELLEPGMTLTFFTQNYGKPFAEEELPVIHKILTMFNGHLFVLELIAKQMRISRMAAQEMFGFLQNKGIYATRNLERVYHYSSSTPQPVYEYVKHIVSSEHLDSSEEYILKNMALLPVTGMIDRKLKAWCELKNYETIEALISKSLVRCDRNTGLLFLHPLIRELILINLRPQARDAEALIKNIAWSIQNSDLKPKQLLDTYDSIVQSLLSKLDTYSENTLSYYQYLLDFGWQCGHFDLVIKRSRDAYRYCRQHRIDYEICGSIARAAGNCCYAAGIQTRTESTRWYHLMWHYYHTIHHSCNKEAAFAAQKIARSYLNYAISCTQVGMTNKTIQSALLRAHSWAQTAWHILNALIADEKNSLYRLEYMTYVGDSYYMEACILMFDRKMQRALSAIEKAISCYRFPDNQIRSHNMIAARILMSKILTETRQFDQAADILKESYEMETCFQKTQSNSYLICIFIAWGDLYSRTGKIQKAASFYQEAAKLTSQIDPPESESYFHEISIKLQLCERAQENCPLMVPISIWVSI